VIRLIAAVDRCRGLAKHGILPWYIPDDEEYFTNQTKLYGGNVLTGGRTFRETYHGPLAGRQNFVLSRDKKPIKNVILVHELENFLKEFTEDLWVAGGSAVFQQVINLGKVDEIYLTQIDANFNCDQFFPDYQADFKLLDQGQQRTQNGFHFNYERYVPNNQ
jgi:dihydrofolate reductase